MFQNKKDLTDVLSIFGHCFEDNTFLLVSDCDLPDLWIPTIKMEGFGSWREYARDLSRDVFCSEVRREKLLKLKKIWTEERDFYHLVFAIPVSFEQKSKCKKKNEWRDMVWLSCSDVQKIKTSLRSAELLEFVQLYKEKTHCFIDNMPIKGELQPMGPLTEINESDLLLVGDNFLTEKHKQLFQNSGFGVEKQCAVYEEFFLMTYPCIYMSFHAFSRFLIKCKWREDHKALFNVADIWERGFLTFEDFMYLVISLEPDTPHSGACAEIRCEYIFGFYDKDQNGKLDFDEFKILLMQIHLARNMALDRAALEREIDEVCNSVGIKFGKTMIISDFLAFIRDAKIRGTSLLLRFNKSIVTDEIEEVKPTPSGKSRRKSSITPYDGKSPLRKSGQEYKIATHTIQMSRRGTLKDVKEVRSLEDAMSTSYAEGLTFLPEIIRPSVDLFDFDSKVNELLLALKYFSLEIRTTDDCRRHDRPKEPYTWGSADLEVIGTTLLLMCSLVKELLANEPRLLNIESPVYIMGDLHGSFKDVASFEKCFWSQGAHITPAKFLFLGDYIDRGPNSVEVIMYLFANKVQNPTKIFLTRGNHELRQVQKMFNFQDDCTSQFGDTLGTKIWYAVNSVFDTMPLAAVIDEKIFCCHGGIPPPWLCPTLSVINSIPCPLTDCQKQSLLAWNLLWNDPVRSIPQVSERQEIELLVREGFAANWKRGTANVFSYDALDRFLKINHLSHVIRAHQVKQAGFQLHQKGKLLTVFSSSSYCGGSNKSATILAAHNILRMFMIDTAN